MTPKLTRVKARLFCEGLRIPPNLWEELGHKGHYRHKRAGLSQGRFFRISDGQARTSVNVPVLEPFVQRSTLELRRGPEGFEVWDDQLLAQVTPFAWPGWYERETSSGELMCSVVSAHCDTSLYTAIYQNGCGWWTPAKKCSFCAMKVDAKTSWRRIEPIIEVVRVALEENPAAELSFGGGTTLTPDRSVKHKAEAIKALKRELDMPVCVEIAPPESNDWLDLLWDSGCNSVLMNLELWNEERRSQLMPGKSQITRQRYLEACRHAVGVFGASQVSSQVIIGLEPLQDTLAGISALAQVGAIPLPVVFRPLGGTPLEDHPLPPLEEVIEVFEFTAQVMREAALDGAKTRSGCALCGACSAHR